mmetsp:Transcript_19365/g.31933  ORF Transcript_19365/g.31933 Transcript_19365/m.31933 type:complete len:173 (-) Transcript_19365:21-539(-)
MERSYYEVLGVPRHAPRAQIRSAFLELAKTTHPDRHHGSPAEGQATTAFETVEKAYRVLHDPEQRRAYDAALAMRGRGAPRNPASAAGWRTGPAMSASDRVWLGQYRQAAASQRRAKVGAGSAAPLMLLLGAFGLFRLGFWMTMSSSEPRTDLELHDALPARRTLYSYMTRT